MQDPYRVSEFDHNVSMITNGVPRALSGTRRLEASRGWLLTPVSSPHAMAALLASLWCSAPPPPCAEHCHPSRADPLFHTGKVRTPSELMSASGTADGAGSHGHARSQRCLRGNSRRWAFGRLRALLLVAKRVYEKEARFFFPLLKALAALLGKVDY